MGSKVKGFLKRFLPTSAKTSKGYTDEILYRLNSMEKKFDSIEKRFDQQEESDEEISQKLEALDKNDRMLSGKIGECTYEIKNEITSESEQITKKLTTIDTDEKLFAEELKSTLKSENKKIDALNTGLSALSDRVEINTEKTFEALSTSAGNIISRIDVSDKKSEENFDSIEENTKSVKAQINESSNILSKKLSENEKSLTSQITDKSNLISGKIDGVSLQLNESEKKLDKKLTELSESAKTLNEQINVIDENLKEIEEISNKICNSTDNFKKLLETADLNCSTEIKGSLTKAANEILEYGKAFEKQTFDRIETVRKLSLDSMRTALESVWANIFNNTITDSNWLINKTFSPGRWAVGYPNLYVTYRVLNEIKPKKILELGLGQSTRMISQYAATHEGTEHIVVEADTNWISFFKNNYEITDRTHLMQFDYEIVPYNDSINVRVFKGLSDFIKEQKFDFITIDAPWSGDQTQLSRIDVLLAIPECLNENFIILFDDCERNAENNTLTKMEEKLNELNVQYAKGRYSGKKDCVLLCANQLKFLTSM